MNAKRLSFIAASIVASCFAALSSLAYADPDVKSAAPDMSAKCRTVEIDYTSSCGDIDNLQSLNHLRHAGECVLLEVNARSRWNASGVLFEGGVKYELEVQLRADDEAPVWCDASIESSPEGWQIPDKSGESTLNTCGDGDPVSFDRLTIAFLKFGKWTSRARGENLFTLVGVTSDKKGKPFKIGMGTEHEATADGEFCSYANDSTFTYANNRGSLMLKVTRMP